MKLRTISGTMVDLLHPTQDTISLEDIAHALSHICRFSGHVHRFYSVAEHSVLMSKMVPEEYALSALMHDAAEAYIGDVTRPVRMYVDIDPLEERFNRVIFDKFNLRVRFDCEEIRVADARMLVTERPDIMMRGAEPYPIHLNYWTPLEARSAFMMRYFELR